MGRIARSIVLIKGSFNILREDKKLIVIPILSFLASLIILGSYLIAGFSFYLYGYLEHVQLSPLAQKIIGGLMTFVFYLMANLIIVFFNAALVIAVYHRINDQACSLSTAFRLAFAKFSLIFKWAMLLATIGVIIRQIEERVGLIGRYIIGLLGLAWTVVSFFVVPIMVLEGKGPIDALKESGQLLRKTFGETLLGFTGIGIMFVFIYIIIGIVIGFSTPYFTHPELGLIAKVIATFCAILFFLSFTIQSTLTTIFRVAIYEYAKSGKTIGTFTPDLIKETAVHRRKK